MAKKKFKYSGEPFGKPEFTQFSENEEYDQSLVNRELIVGFNYYNYEGNIKDAKKWFLEYIKKSGDYSSSDIRAVKSTSDYNIGMTHGSLAKMLSTGLPPRDEYKFKIREKVTDIIERTRNNTSETETTAKKPDVNVPTIKDRMMENLREFLGEYVEEEIDHMIQNNGNSKFKLGPLLIEKEIPGRQSGIIAKEYQKDVDELTLVLTGTEDEDLLEAYAGQSKPALRKIRDFYQMLVDDATHHAQRKKATRKVRVKKKPSTEKLIAKVKYQKSDDSLKLVSEGPENIIGAKEVWLYNTQKRKLTKLVAKDQELGTLLSIKGTTIQDYDESLSSMKNIRKPEETLTEFKKAGKVALRKFMDEIKAKGATATGRLNADTIILKTVK